MSAGARGAQRDGAAAGRGRTGPGERDKAGRKGKGRWKREMTTGARKTKENTREAVEPSGNLLQARVSAPRPWGAAVRAERGRAQLGWRRGAVRGEPEG